MKVTIDDIYRKFDSLTKDGFTGEAVLRFAGCVHEGLFTLHKDIRDDKRPNQDIALVKNIYSLCRRFDAFGSITMIWHEGGIKNYTVKLTFQGIDAHFQTKSIFQCGS